MNLAVPGRVILDNPGAFWGRGFDILDLTTQGIQVTVKKELLSLDGKDPNEHYPGGL